MAKGCSACPLVSVAPESREQMSLAGLNELSGQYPAHEILSAKGRIGLAQFIQQEGRQIEQMRQPQ